MPTIWASLPKRRPFNGSEDETFLVAPRTRPLAKATPYAPYRTTDPLIFLSGRGNGISDADDHHHHETTRMAGWARR